jgi:hypothetical protein
MVALMAFCVVANERVNARQVKHAHASEMEQLT